MPFVENSNTFKKYHGSKLTMFDPTNADEISEILKKIQLKTSELDPAPASVLSECKPVITPFLVDVVNTSLATGSMEGVKNALVKPSLKKHGLDYDNLKNYRPISNLSFIGKLIERGVLNRFNTHMSNNNLHSDYEHGYKKKTCNRNALTKFIDVILVAIDKKLGMVVLIVGLSAAFDTVRHHVLLNILSSELGISGVALNGLNHFSLDEVKKNI